MADLGGGGSRGGGGQVGWGWGAGGVGVKCLHRAKAFGHPEMYEYCMNTL